MTTMDLVSTILVSRPAREVFDFLADYANDPQWRDGVLSMRADGPAVPGATTHEELTFLGSVYVTEGVVTERTDTRLAFRGESASVASEGYREAVPEADATRVTYRLRLEPRGALRLFRFLLEPLYARRVARDLERLKDILEARAAVPRAA